MNALTLKRVAIGLLVIAALALALRLALPQPVLVQVGGTGQSCLMCRQTAWGDTFTLRASGVTRSYRFTRDMTARLEFAGGAVRFAGDQLTPGCHVLDAQEGHLLRFERAGEVRLDTPAPAAGCL
jgi:hypothetical protein